MNHINQNFGSVLLLFLLVNTVCVTKSFALAVNKAKELNNARNSDVFKNPDDVGNAPANVIVKVTTGMIQGHKRKVTSDLAIETFLGIPYGAPPTGDNRFASPKPSAPWTGVRNAFEFGNQCPGRGLDPGEQADTPYSEDCLYLNVYSPKYTNRTKDTTDGELLPVMFWIHGGGYYGGTGSTYNGTLLALRGVVVVTINYRLDIFGFLSTADSVIPGNFGMLDQLMAMDWVRDNIAAFGGNPKDITIFGESAGASSVSLHLLSPLSKGKFQKAIMESGTSLCPWAVNPSNTTYYAPKQFAQLLGLAVGCSHQESVQLLICLRGIEESYLINATIGLQLTMRHAMIWLPVVETTFGFLPDTPTNLIANGNMLDIPTIRGYNKNELGVTVKDPTNVGFSVGKLLSLVAETTYFFFQKNNILVAGEVEAAYINNQTNPFGRRSDFERLMTDYYMVAPITYEAQQHALLQKTSKSYLYEFSYRASFNTLPTWMGVVHTQELPFVFGLPRGPAKLSYNTTNLDDIKMANTMVTLWTNFAKTGNPTPQTSDCTKPSPRAPRANSGQSLQFHQQEHHHEPLAPIVKQLHHNSEYNYQQCLTTTKHSYKTLGPLLWQPLNTDRNTLLEINTNTTVGQFARTNAVDLWMVRIPKLEKKKVKN